MCRLGVPNGHEQGWHGGRISSPLNDGERIRPWHLLQLRRRNNKTKRSVTSEHVGSAEVTRAYPSKGFDKPAAIARWTRKRASPLAAGGAFSKARETSVLAGRSVRKRSPAPKLGGDEKVLLVPAVAGGWLLRGRSDALRRAGTADCS